MGLWLIVDIGGSYEMAKFVWRGAALVPGPVPDGFEGVGILCSAWCSSWGGGGCPVGSTILGEAEEARAAWAFEIYLKCLGNSKFCPTSFSLHLVANKINSK
jgi:hypothetical protein